MPERGGGHVRVAVVDDEPMARSSLRALLGADPEVEVVAECRNGGEALQAIRELRPDIVFLDVHMPGMSGFDVVEALEDETLPLIVFVTAYDRYALRAFDVHAVDYVLKPFDDDRFRTALERAKERVRSQRGADPGGGVLELLEAVREGEADRSAAAAGRPAERLAIHREGRIDWVDVGALRWIEAADQYVMLHALDGDHLMRESMSELERALDPRRFLRVHRSAIVAVARIRTFERFPNGGGRLRLDDGQWVPVSRSRARALKRLLG